MAGTQRERERGLGVLAQPISGVRNDGNPSFCASRGDRVVLAENLSYPALPAAAGALMHSLVSKPPPAANLSAPWTPHQYSGACVPTLQRYGRL
jgi:hypothetical protein